MDIVQCLSDSADALLLASAQALEAGALGCGHSASGWRQAEYSAAVRSLGALVQKTCKQLDTWRARNSEVAEWGMEREAEESRQRERGLDREVHLKVMGQLLEHNLPIKLLSCLEHLEFEARKAAAHILFELFEGAGGTVGQIVEYVRSTPEMVQGILNCCAHEKVFFLGAQMVRSATRCSQLTSALLENGCLLKLLSLCFHANFEISNEAFASVRALLLNQQRLAAEHVEANFVEFFTLYNSLLQREKDYVVQRQALRLLAQLLLDRTFQSVMVRYVKEECFLQIHMNLLRDASQMIPLEAFHVFKLFVANPHKPQPVRRILCRNGRRLANFLESFRQRQNDDGFEQDLDMVLDMLDDLSSQ